MSIADTTENAILNLIFSATAWANYADNAAGTPQTNIAMAAHTGDPGEAGTQSTSEAAYTGYARPNVARSGSGWTTASAGSISPQANITFGTYTAGATTALTHFSAGKTGGGASAILWSGTITPNVTPAATVNPTITTATTITLD